MLFGLFGVGEIELGADLGAEVVASHQWRQQGIDARLIAALQCLGIFQRAAIEIERIACRARQRIAVLVDDGDVFAGQALHAAGHQMLDGLDLTCLELLAALEFNHHRRRRWAALAHEDGIFRQCQVHTGAGHRLETGDGARQLAGQGALVIDVFGELADAEGLGIHQLEAGTSLTGQALLGKCQTQTIDIFLGDLDGGAFIAQSIGHAGLLQLRDDLAAFAGGQITIEHTPLGASAPQQQRDDDSHAEGGRHDERQTWQCRQARQQGVGWFVR